MTNPKETNRRPNYIYDERSPDELVKKYYENQSQTSQQEQTPLDDTSRAEGVWGK